MARVGLLKINVRFPNFHTTLLRNEERIGRFVAAQIQFNRGQLFDKEGAYNGRDRWAPLKLRKGQILSLTGTLRKSISPGTDSGQAGPGGIVSISGDLARKVVRVGTTLGYAPMMNFGTAGLPGGVLKPKQAKVLRIPIDGQKYIFAKEVKIPERRFDTWNEEDKNELAISLTNLVTAILNGD